MIPYGRQSISEADIAAVERVLRSDFLTQGPMVPRFEAAVAHWCGAARGVAVNSATSALHLACLALDVGPGDRVWTSPNTFVASANCALYCGAEIDFVDIDPVTYNLSVEALKEKLEHAEQAGALPKVVIPVHFAGQSCDMRGIRRLADRYQFRVVEDASHAIGGEYAETRVGSCAYSDITVFSFHPVKIITTGEGGMAVTNDAALADAMERLRSHGIVRDPADMTESPHGPWYYQQIELGFNYRMTDLQAALGFSQLDRLSSVMARRAALVDRYDHLLTGLPVKTPCVMSNCRSAWHLYVVRLRLDEIESDRAEVFNAMREGGVGVNVHYIPVHIQPWYRQMGFRDGMFPEAERYYSEALTLPLYPELSFHKQDHVINVLRRALCHG